jgi:hypothetical protein
MLPPIPEERDVESGLLVVEETPQDDRYATLVKVGIYALLTAIVGALIYMFYWGLSQEKL